MLAAVRVHGHAMEYASEDIGGVFSLSFCCFWLSGLVCLFAYFLTARLKNLVRVYKGLVGFYDSGFRVSLTGSLRPSVRR